MGDSITTSLWVRSATSQSPLIKVAAYYEGANWTIDRVVGCDPASFVRPVLSMLDLDVGERMRLQDLSASAWILQVELHRLHNKTSGRRETRCIQFGPSSIPCPWAEHPIEVVVPLSFSIPISKKDRSASKRRDELIGEVYALCDELGASWATMSDFGRGPSLPELSLKSRPAYVDLSTIYLLNTDFEDSAVRRLLSAVRVEQSPSGWFFSTNPLFGGSPSRSPSYDQEVWKLLSNWARRRVGAPAPPGE